MKLVKCVLVVLNYNDFKTTEKFVECVKDYKSIDRVVIVDNCSTDDSFTRLYQHVSEKVEVIRTVSNKGYANGNNYGAFYSIKKYKPCCLIISNPDVFFTEEYLEKIIEFTIDKDRVGMVSGVMKSKAELTTMPPPAWKLPRYFDLIMSNFLILRRLVGNQTLYNDNELNGDIVQVDVLPGSFFSIKASTFKCVGGFNDKTFLYEEENILAHKLKEYGYKNYLLLNQSYIHDHAVSINKSIPTVGKRLDIDFESRIIYASDCLKCSKFKLWLLKITYYIGKFNYLMCLKLTNIKR